MMSDLYIGQGVEVEDEENPKWNKLGTVARIGENQQYLIARGLTSMWHHRKVLRPIGQAQICSKDNGNRGETTWRRTASPQKQGTFHDDVDLTFWLGFYVRLKFHRFFAQQKLIKLLHSIIQPNDLTKGQSRARP